MNVISTKLVNFGYTFTDMLQCAVGEIRLNPQNHTEDVIHENKAECEKYTKEYLNKLGRTVQDIMDGRITVSHRDTRSYCDVVAAAITNV